MGIVIALYETNWLLLVLPPISTEGLTAADVDRLTKTAQESMLKALLELSNQDRDEIDSDVKKATSTAVEI